MLISERIMRTNIDRIHRIAKDILNAQSRVEARKNFEDFCDTCNRENCRDCDGRNKYQEKEFPK